MTVALTTICLNEMEWLPKLYEQHKDWPDLLAWIFVEGADKVYQETNPSMVNSNGLSVDGTSRFLRELEQKDSRVTYVPYGLAYNDHKELGKVALRQKCLEIVERRNPDYVVILDADEFYVKSDQEQVNALMASSDADYYCFGWTHIWHPPSMYDEPLFSREIQGGFWGMDHMKGFRWQKGMRYTDCHQHPRREDGTHEMEVFGRPRCVHMAFASEATKRYAKHAYYERRGERTDPARARYCAARSLFSRWFPGDKVPKGVEILDYTGPIPEAFLDDASFIS